jgi:hypothetical protein
MTAEDPESSGEDNTAFWRDDVETSIETSGGGVTATEDGTRELFEDCIVLVSCVETFDGEGSSGADIAGSDLKGETRWTEDIGAIAGILKDGEEARNGDDSGGWSVLVFLGLGDGNVGFGAGRFADNLAVVGSSDGRSTCSCFTRSLMLFARQAG